MLFSAACLICTVLCNKGSSFQVRQAVTQPGSRQLRDVKNNSLQVPSSRSTSEQEGPAYWEREDLAASSLPDAGIGKVQ